MKKFCLILLALFSVNNVIAQALINRRGSTTRAPISPSENIAFSSALSNEDESLTSDLNFRNAEIDQIFLTYGRLVERTVLKDPATPNLTLTFQSRRGHKLTKAEQIEAIEVLLEMNGIHFENYGEKFVRAISRKDARKEGIPLYLDVDDPAITFVPEGRVISVNLAFKNITTEEAQKALEGFKSNNGLLQVFERTNSIVVTDTRQNINRMAEIAKMIDVATPVMEIVEVVQIKNASATDIQNALQKIVEDAMKYQEKDAKNQNVQNNAAQNMMRPSLMRRASAANQPEPKPEAPTSVESLITSVSDADRGMIRGRVLIVPDERSNKLIIVTNKSNMDFFRKVIAALDVETTPDTVVKVYRLKYADADDVSGMINDLIGNTAQSSSRQNQNQNQNARSGTGGNLTRNTTQQARTTPANTRTGEAKAGELSKDNTTVLADKRINGLVVMTQKELIPTVESIIESMDVKLSQVLIETMILEVTLDDEVKTGLDWVQLGAKRADGSSSMINQNNYMLGGGAGGENSTALLQNVVQGAGDFGTATPIGAGINYLLKSDRLNLGAVVQATKTDMRGKYLASPVVMTVDNKEATIDATDMRYLFKGYQYSGSTYNGSPVPDYEQKEIGIKIKVKPKINPNGTVMLNLDVSYEKINKEEQTISQIIDEKSVSMKQDTTTTRKMTADAILDNGQTVILGGLMRIESSESQTGIPILKDIPWIGKWLFGSVSQNEARKELLIFMTPYVLNDADEAQVEAARRKKALSDARPWDDHGWSASELADPVSKKELLRRLKEEASKQDEEFETRKQLEAWKKNRANELLERARKNAAEDAEKEETEAMLNLLD